MTALPAPSLPPGRRGWCPTLHAPMPSGDGMLVRVRPPLGRLSAAQARRLADAAERHGVRTLELTARAALQLRGLAPAAVAPLADALLATGLAHPDPAAEAAPPVLLSPLAGADPGAHPAALPLARALSQALGTDPALRSLPPKALLAVDAGGALPLAPPGADLLLRADNAGALLLLPTAAARVSGDPLVLVLALLRRWATHHPATRLRVLDPALLLAPLGLRALPPAPTAEPLAGHAVGPIAGTDAIGLAPPLARLTPAGLRHLATLAECHGDGLLRLTPWRSVLLAGVTPWALPALLRDAAGLIATPRDPLLRLVACPGNEGCASGEAATLRDAATLSGLLPPGTARVHLSGCAKGCAHPGIATTLTARGGRYDLVREGRAGDPPEAVGLGVKEAVWLLGA